MCCPSMVMQTEIGGQSACMFCFVEDDGARAIAKLVALRLGDVRHCSMIVAMQFIMNI
jgi:hypothetical protein